MNQWQNSSAWSIVGPCSEAFFGRPMISLRVASGKVMAGKKESRCLSDGRALVAPAPDAVSDGADAGEHDAEAAEHEEDRGIQRGAVALIRAAHAHRAG